MQEQTAHKPLKEPPAYLFAMGRQNAPETLTVAGRTYRFYKLFKHDFFALTAMYLDETPPATDELKGETPTYAVLKIQRTYHLFGFPMQWLGRIVANHEIGIFEKLQGVAGVPAFLGRYGRTGFLHAFVPGEPLTPQHPFTPKFFDDLHQLFTDIHARGIAYVDSNKRENILFGDDGKPWLIDFQISFRSRSFLSRWFLKHMQAEDWYHYYKHKTRLMPQHCTPEEIARAERQSWLIKLHRFFAQPIIRVRRKFLSRYKLEKVK